MGWWFSPTICWRIFLEMCQVTITLPANLRRCVLAVEVPGIFLWDDLVRGVLYDDQKKPARFVQLTVYIVWKEWGVFSNLMPFP